MTAQNEQRPGEDTNVELTSEELVKRLKKALGNDGDFPASARVVSELRTLASDPSSTAQQITEVILREPSLGARVLHVVNSTAYHRGTPIMTVSQAVLRLGMKQLAELCAGLILLQKFVPSSRRGGAFANCLKRMIVTALLSSSFGREQLKESPNATKSECGYLAGMLAEMGVLLLAYYFPHVYDNAAKRTETKKQSIDQSIFEITGLSPINLSLEALHSLNLPVYYKTLFQVAIGKPDKSIKTLPANEREEIERSAGALKAAMVVSAAVCQDDGKHELDLALEEVVAGLSIEENRVRTLVGELPAAFVGHCSLLEADLPPLPDFVASYAATEEEAAIATGKESDIFQKFVDEIRQSVDNHEPTATVITSVMETLAWGLKFDRVVLLLVSPTRNALVGRMGLGKIDGVEPKKISRPIGAGTPTKASDVQAFSESRPVYQGTPLLEGGWPFAAIPVGSRAKSIGVIYADRVQSKDMELTSKEKAALGILVDLLDRSVAMQ